MTAPAAVPAPPPAPSARPSSPATDRRAALLARVRARSSGSGERVGPAPLVAGPRSPGVPAPASFSQEQTWVAQQMAGSTPLHNVSFALHLEGPLDADRLQLAAAGLAERHPVLRSSFGTGPAGLEVRPGAHPATRPALRDLSRSADPDRRARTRIDALARTRFDLAAGPPVRTELLRLGAERHVLMWVAHHCVVDGASFGVLLDELRALYAGLPHAGGAPACDGPDFTDFALRQRQEASGPGRPEALEHWAGVLKGAVPAALPPDLPRPAAPGHRGHSIPFGLDGTERLRAVAASSGTTLFAALLAVAGTALWQHSGGDRLTVGVPMADRGLPGTERLVGPFSTTVPLLLPFSAGMTGRRLLTEVSGALLDADRYQDVSMAKLVDRLGLPRDPTRNPLFQTLVNAGNLPGGACRGFAPDLALRVEAVPNGTVRMDAELTFELHGAQVSGRFEYDQDLYHETTAAEFVRHFAVLLRTTADHPDLPLAELPRPKTDLG
ncbi:condensation domain-containing protein [Streptomyces sp. NBC_00338]|uniref:condensation domain-containing protein n=1 Tax=Streptomyces sp. NBC_00338 TaxID=2975715 RepID=UPI00224DEFD0|nr:condensation domain-containing protein [Streptomyces sp. NBC_00338]MCX5141818.1 condensation domain-containing protein [Streptomyces sp. NBC_00338]